MKIFSPGLFNPYHTLAVLEHMNYAGKDFAQHTKGEILAIKAKIKKEEEEKKKQAKLITIEIIRKSVASYFCIKEELLDAKTRKREIVQARQIAMYFSKFMTKCSLSTIGRAIGNKNHSTVLHSTAVVMDDCQTNIYFRKDIENIKKLILNS